MALSDVQPQLAAAPAANDPSQAPSTRRGPMVAPEQPSRWPMVVGVISIVFAAGAILLGLWNSAAMPLMRGFLHAMPRMPGQPDPTVGLENNQTSIILLGLVSAAVAGVLLAGAIGLVKRRWWARRVILIWATIKILLVIATTALAYAIQTENFQAIQVSSSAGGPPAQMMSLMKVFLPVIQIGTVVVGILWGWALPVFCVVWFLRRKIRTEVASWRAIPVTGMVGSTSPSPGPSHGPTGG